MATQGTKSMLDKKPLLLLMDGHAMVYRAWYAIQQPLNVSRTGEEVRAVFGFLNTFLRSISDWQPTHCAIAFDLSGPTFRHREYDEYKAQRPPMPPELPTQVDRVREMMRVFGVPVFDKEEYEADDVLGTLCRQAEEQQIEALVLTGDTDELQLVSPWVRVLLSFSVGGKTLYDVAAVKERYDGLGPELIPDIKALEGDTSDNIPGVPGIGRHPRYPATQEIRLPRGHIREPGQGDLNQNAAKPSRPQGAGTSWEVPDHHCQGCPVGV